MFHTSTGLRAVNPDVARGANPLAKIGKLQVGHVLYRLNEGPIDGHPTYECREIKSIEIADAGPQVVYNVSAPNIISYHANGYVVDTNNLEVSGTILRFLLAPQNGQVGALCTKPLSDPHREGY